MHASPRMLLSVTWYGPLFWCQMIVMRRKNQWAIWQNVSGHSSRSVIYVTTLLMRPLASLYWSLVRVTQNRALCLRNNALSSDVLDSDFAPSKLHRWIETFMMNWNDRTNYINYNTCTHCDHRWAFWFGARERQPSIKCLLSICAIYYRLFVRISDMSKENWFYTCAWIV